MSNKRKATDAPEDDSAMLSMRGKTLLITGGAQGLGLAVARMAAKRGVRNIVICDKNDATSAVIVEELSGLGARCLFVKCDVGVPDEITAAVSAAEERFGKIDGLVNAAGDTARGDLDSTSVEQWDRQHNVNLRAVYLFTQAVSQSMRRHGVRGSIVNIASVQAYGGLTFCMGYAVAKAGLVALTKNNAAELGRHGIRVNAVNMGWTATDAEDVLQTAESGAGWLADADRTCALGRISRPADIAHGVLFLLSDAAHTTGSVLQLHPEFIVGMLGGGIGKAKDVDK